MLRRIYILLFLIFSIFISTVAEPLQKIRVQLNKKHRFEFAGFYAAKEQGYYEHLGLDVEIVENRTEIDVIKSVTDGRAEFAICDAELFDDVDNISEIKLIANYLKHSPLSIVTPKEIIFPQMLEGEKIIGDMAQFDSLSFKEFSNLYFTNFVEVQKPFNKNFFADDFKNITEAFLLSSIDDIYKLNNSKLEYNLFTPANYGIKDLGVNVIVDKTFSEKNKDVILKFKNATDRGWEYSLNNKEEVVDIIYDNYSQERSKELLKFEANYIEKLMLRNIFKIGSPNKFELTKILDVSHGSNDYREVLDSLVPDYDESEFLAHERRLNLSHDEKNYLSNNPVIRAYADASYPPFDYNVNGKQLGFTVDLLSEVSKIAGFQINWITYRDWSQAKKDLLSEKIDLVQNVSKTEAREKIWNYSKPYFSNYKGIFTQVDSDINSLEDLKSKRVAVVSGFLENKILKERDDDIELVVYESTIEALRAVNFNEVDATIFDTAVANFLINENKLRNIKSVSSVELEQFINYNFHFASKKNNPLLISIINKALAEIDTDKMNYLKQEWLLRKVEKENSVKPLILTSEEKKYIKSSAAVRVALTQGDVPFSYTSNNVEQGYIVDLFDIISNKTGLKFEKYLDNWASNIIKFKEGKLDLMGGISYEQDRVEYMSFTDPYYQMPIMVYTRENDFFYRDADSLKGKRIGVISSNFLNDEILDIPDVKVREYSEIEEILKDISDNKLDALITSFNLYYNLNDLGFSNIKAAGEIQFDNHYNEDLRIGIRKENAILTSIMKKALASLTFSEKEKLKQKWIVNIEFIDTLNNAMANMTSEEKELLQKKWFNSYSNITPVLTPEEKRYLEENPILKVSSDLDFLPFDFVVDGKSTGFSTEYMELLAEKVGVKLKFVQSDFSDLMRKFENNEIDIIQLLLKTSEREKSIIYSDKPLITSTFAYVFKKGDNFNKKEELVGKKLGMIKGWVQTDSYKKILSETKIVEYNTTEDLMQALIYGEVDLAFTYRETALYYIDQNNILSLTVSSKNMYIETNDMKKDSGLYLAMKKDKVLLKSIFDKAENVVSFEEKKRLREKWFGKEGSTDNFTIFESEKEKKKVKLTEREKKYLEKKGSLRMSIVPNWLPFDSINEKGKHEGISADFVKLMESRLGIDFELVETSEWKDSLQNMREKKIDILPMAMNTTSRRRDMNFTEPYIVEPFVIATFSSELFIKDVSEILDKKIGIVKSYAIKEILKNRYPQINILDINNAEEGIEMIRKGQIFAYIDSAPAIGYVIRKHGVVDIKIAGRLYFDLKLSIATRNDEEILLGIMQKTLDSISEEEKNSIINKWNTVKYEGGMDKKLIRRIIVAVLIIVSFLLIIIVFYLFYTRRLTQLNKEVESHLEHEAKQKAIAYKLNEIFNEITSSRELDEVLSLIVKSILEVVDSDTVDIFIKRDNQFVLTANGGKDREPLNLGTVISEKEVFYIERLKEGKSLVYIENLQKLNIPKYGKNVNLIKSVLLAPLVQNDILLGFMTICSHDVKKFDQYEINTIETIAKNTVIALNNANHIAEINEKNTQLEERNFEVEQINLSLEEANEKLNMTIEGADLAPVEIDLIDNTVLFGFSYDYDKDFDGTIEGFYKCIHPSDLAQIKDSLSRHLEGNNDICSEEFRFKVKGDKYIWLNMIVKVMKWDEEKTPTRLVGINLNITDRKNTEQQMIRSEKMAALGQLVASVAHEINTPLGAINSSAENIDKSIKHILDKFPELIMKLEKINLKELFFSMVSQGVKNNTILSPREKRKKRKELRSFLEDKNYENPREIADFFVNIGVYEDIENYLSFALDEDRELIFKNALNIILLIKSISVIQNSVTGASKIVYALKSYARSGQSEEKKQFNLRESLETVLTIYNNKIKYGVEVIQNYPDNLSDSEGFVDELNQVWTNLISNALQAMKFKGKLIIEVKEDNKYHTVEISDTGEGIPSDIKDKIFEPFFTTKAEGEGTGLGLDIVKKIIDKHNGEIYFKSRIDEGTTFYIKLPKF